MCWHACIVHRPYEANRYEEEMQKAKTEDASFYAKDYKSYTHPITEFLLILDQVYPDNAK